MDDRLALIRGINVGRAKRVAMHDVRAVMTRLGYSDVRTVLNSGNVLFKDSRGTPQDSARRIEHALTAHLGLSVRVLVRSAADLAEAIADNPLGSVADVPSRLLVVFVRSHRALARLTPLTRKDWGPEALGIGRRAAYLWCAEGIHKSKLAASVDRVLEGESTARNWGTVIKLHALATASRRA